MLQVVSATLPVLVVLGVLRSDPVAHCHGCEHPRTPVMWDGSPCMTLVDRSVDPVLHIEYAIPFEDTALAPEDLPDSRRHQFFAFCRDRSAVEWLPDWITDGDVAAAVAGELIAPPIAPDDILEHALDWLGCWSRINADDDRRPITWASAAAGVDWDTTMLAPGAYVIDGYTWEPEFNLWWPRPGVVKVHDGKPDAIGPAAAVTLTNDALYRDETIELTGCVDAIEGTTMRAAWAAFDADPDLVWRALGPAEPIAGDTFALSFAVPPAFVDAQNGVLRVDFEDPLGRAYTAYPRGALLVLDADHDATTTSDGGSSDTTGPLGESSSSESESGIEHGILPEPDPSTARGCGCNSEPIATLPILFAIPILARRRSRR